MAVLMYSRLVRASNPSHLSDESRDNEATPNGRVSTRGRRFPELAPFYYLKNFELVLTTILSRYSDLLLEGELRFITGFPQLPLASRALLTRMVMRRGDLFRARK